MKHLTLFFLIFLISCDKAENREFGQIDVSLFYCKYGKSNNEFAPKFKLFKKGKEMVELKLPENNNNYNLIVSNLEFGKYYIEYKTIYNQKKQVEFEIDRVTPKKIQLCYDYLNYDANQNILLLDEMKAGDSLIISYFHEGCFDTFVKPVELKITKTSEKLFAEYNGKKYDLTTSQIQLLKEFEIELRSNHKGGCSSKDSYTIFNKNGYEIYEISDSSCQWYGFKYLIKLLKFKS